MNTNSVALSHGCWKRVARGWRWLALGVLVLLAAGCGTTRITGRVLDEQDRPLSKVEVATIPATDELITTRDGSFSIERTLLGDTVTAPIRPGSYKLILKRNRFEDKEIPLEVKEGKAADLGAIRLTEKKIMVRDDPNDLEPCKECRQAVEPGAIFIGE